MDRQMEARWWDVMVNGQRVGVLRRARGGGYTLRTGPSLIRPRVHHFSPREGLTGVSAYVEGRFGDAPELIPGRED